MNGDELTITFDGDLATDAGSTPAGTDFAVKATRGGTERDVELTDTAPVVSGKTVTLTLAEAVLSIDTLTVGYTPGTNKLKDSDKEMNPVPGFTGKAVTNNTPADTTRPTVTSAAINGANRPTTLSVTFSESLENAAQHQNTAFLLFVDGTAGGSQNVSVSGDTATVTFAANDWVQHGESLTLDYKVPTDADQRIKDPSGNEVLAFSARGGDQQHPAAVLLGGGERAPADDHLRWRPGHGRRLEAGGERLRGEGDACGDRAGRGPGGTGPGGGERHGGDADARGSGVGHRHGDGGLHAGHEHAQGFRQRDGRGAGLLRQGGDQRHAGGPAAGGDRYRGYRVGDARCGRRRHERHLPGG